MSTRFVPKSNPILAFWYKLYSKPTRSEEALEPWIARLGAPYRFQHLVGMKYILDFALLDQKIAIEVDDPGHERRDKRLKDKARTEWLTARGWTVVRITNDEAVRWPCASLNRAMIQAGSTLRCEPPKEKENPCSTF